MCGQAKSWKLRSLQAVFCLGGIRERCKGRKDSRTKLKNSIVRLNVMVTDSLDLTDDSEALLKAVAIGNHKKIFLEVRRRLRLNRQKAHLKAVL